MLLVRIATTAVTFTFPPSEFEFGNIFVEHCVFAAKFFLN